MISLYHCVYWEGNGGWARSIEVAPGRNGSEQVFGSCVATDFRSVRGWTVKGKRECDYAAIILPAEFRFGEQVGYFGCTIGTDEELAGLNVNISGYPGDKHKTQPYTQWKHSRVLTGISDVNLFYDIDTFAGQSGWPVWWKQGDQRHVVGIHNYRHDTGSAGPQGKWNFATRITEPVFNNIQVWRDEGA